MMTESLIVANNLHDKSVEESNVYIAASSDLNGIGNFVQGSDKGVSFSSNNIDKLNDTLVFGLSNPTTSKLNVNLFGFTDTLFSIIINPPPSILNGILPPTGASPVESAFCPINGFIYTDDQVGDSVTVIDCVTNAVVTTVILPVGFGPRAIAYCPVNNSIYVASNFLAQVVRIDCATNTIVGAPIAMTTSVFQSGMTYNSVSNTMYCLNSGAAFVDVIDCVTNLLIANFIIPGGLFITGIAYNSILNRVYITDQVTNNVYAVNCAINLVIATIPSGVLNPQAISFCSANNSMYVNGFVSNDFVAINCTTNVAGVPVFIFAANPQAITYNPINNLMYVTMVLNNNMYIIDCATNTVLSFVALGGVGATGIVHNGNSNSIWITYTATNNVQGFLPISPPSVVVTLSGGYTLGDLYNDLQGKPLFLKGLKMIVESINQFFNNISVNYYSIYGKQDLVQFQPTNYISPTNAQSLIIDAADFSVEVDGNTNVTFDIEPLSSMIISFTMNKGVDNTTPLFTDITQDWGAGTDDTTNTRMTGNPVADIVLKQEAEKILSESGYNSQVQYAFYPRETGNPVVDIALLNQAGF